VSDVQSPPGRRDQLSERERTRIEGSFGTVLILLIITVFFSISAPDEPWAELATAVVLAIALSITMLASGARPRIVRIWLGVAVLGIGVSIIIALTQVGPASGYLALTNLFLTLVTMNGLVRRLWQNAEISVLTVLGALCVYVLLGLSFGFAFAAVGEIGSRPFFASQERGTLSDYMYFSFVTLATLGYGDLTPQGGIGRALAVTEGLIGQIYLVTAVAALVSNIGRARIPPR
jgi:Ion channel